MRYKQLKKCPAKKADIHLRNVYPLELFSIIKVP